MFSLLRRYWSRRSSDRQAVGRFRPTLEAFEDRCLPSLLTVTNLRDAGRGSLRQAILRANRTAGADTIQFASGLTGTIRLTSGELAIHDRVRILGPSTRRLAVSGNHLSRVFNVDGTATIANLGIIEGDATAGGGVLNIGFLKLKNVLMTDNSADDGGAVMSINGSGGSAGLTIINSKLANNASRRDGGAVFNDLDSSAFIRNTTITTNQCTGLGAGIFNGGLGTMTIVSSTVAHNIQRSLGGAGGGIFANGTLAILACTITANIAAGGAGGIAFEDGALSIMNSTIANNTALAGVGIGGIGAGTFSNVSINNSTITGNVDASGAGTGAGGISYLGDFLTLNNTVVADNFATGGGPPDIRGRVRSASHNFIGTGTAALIGITNGTDGNRVGTLAAPLDPKLGPLENNGGRTLTRSPRPGSPLINGGVNALLPAGARTDQRGFRRIGFGIVDIGAVEFGVRR